ncbi:hypothetical protein AAFF_G00084300 [Aldrovandia affinis]|uniref:Uncharacterized protein n=1 Tax=Aldrovandia affinis TaxID=143900 RepID=A0AAD7RX15_9TELE|nr:hypothetical protein AAFF_G00084300 [Aldrovandia affinis]
MGLASQVLCFWQQPVFREVQSAILQGLAELGAGQGPSITSPPIGANVHHAERRVIRGPTLVSSSSNWARSSLKYRWNLSPSSRSSCTSL